MNHWDVIAARLRLTEGIFLALDYDGVLSPIAIRPELARMPARNRELLDALSNHPRVRVAVVSGRALADVRERVGVSAIFYAGNHGAEIDLKGDTERHIPLERFRAALLQARKELHDLIEEFPGLRLEDKGFGIALHYREVGDTQLPALHARFAVWAKSLPADLHVTTAKMLYEIRPNMGWNKGNAVLRIWQSIAPRWLPFCLGDDKTDEDGFVALKGRGINIFVGTTTADSAADFSLDSTDQVTEFLERLLKTVTETLTI